MKNRAAYILLLALVLALAACGINGNGTAPPEDGTPVILTISAGERQDTLDPARSTARGGETVLYHLYENLLRWEDDGSGWAVTAPGQAERYTVETDYAGNQTYTFTLREDIFWSDGQPVTAADFVTAWRRLADPANALPHRELLAVVAGYEEVQETGDPKRLAVSAPGTRTFSVTLDGSCGYFLDELCAGAYTMPVREDLAGTWGTQAGTSVTNGAYTAAQWTGDLLCLKRSGTYYRRTDTGPEELRFVPSGNPAADAQRLTAGELDFAGGLPDSALGELPDGWTPEPETTVYGILFNTAAPPFDNPDVRRAFQLAIDTETAARALNDRTAQPAAGWIPYGIADYTPRPGKSESEAAFRPAWDFRTHSLDKVTVPSAGNYEENCREAKQLLAQAGYPNGNNFPVTEYVYVKSETNDALAGALRQMWQEKLGTALVLRGVTQAEYDALLSQNPEEAPEEENETSADDGDGGTKAAQRSFTMAAQSFSAAYNDAEALLNCWRSTSPDNPGGYQSEAFDILLETAHTAAAPEVRDALLHDAEAILLTDVPVIPVYYQGSGSRLAEKWTGLYRGPDGVYFFFDVAAAPR